MDRRGVQFLRDLYEFYRHLFRCHEYVGTQNQRNVYGERFHRQRRQKAFLFRDVNPAIDRRVICLGYILTGDKICWIVRCTGFVRVVALGDVFYLVHQR